MTANDRFFQELQPAAVLKHSVLAEYCTVFTSMIGRRFPGTIWLIDGYAGPGFYTSTEPGGQPIAGSPVVAMRIAAKWKGTRDLRCVFIEADPRYAAELASNVQPYEQSGLVPIVLAGPVQDRLRDAWEHVAGSPVVTFLDPFGVAMPTNPMTDLLLAKGRPRPSEVLLNINLEAVGRLDGWLEERGGSVVPKPGMRKGVERVDAFFGDTWWREEFYRARTNSASGSAAAAAEVVVAQYRKRTERTTGCLSMSIPIRRRPGHPALFHLTLFYRQPIAGYKFADAACRANRKWRDRYRAEDLAGALTPVPDALFDLTEHIEATFKAEVDREEALIITQAVGVIKSNILALLTANSRVSVVDQIGPVLGSTLSLAGESQIIKAWDQLADEGAVVARDKSRKLYQQDLIAKR